jgi:hypothetical protein
VFYNPPYQQGYHRVPQSHHIYNQNLSAPPPPANQNQNQNQNSGTPWQGFEWEALSGPNHPFSRERYSQSFPQVDIFHYAHHLASIRAGRDPFRFEVPTRRPDLDNLYEDDVHLDYMDFDLGQSNPIPRGLTHHSINTGTQPQATGPQAKHTTPLTSKDTSSAKSPPSFHRLPASVGAGLSTTSKPASVKPGQQPIDRVMVLQRRPDAPRLSNAGSSTTPNNNSLYNRQLDFTPSLLSQPPVEYVLDATFSKIAARDAARKTNAIRIKQTATTNDSKAPSVLPVVPNQQLGRIREKSHQDNGGSQKTPRPPHAGLPKCSQPTAVGSCIMVKVTSEKASCSERNHTYGPHSHEPSTRTVGVFPALYGDNTSSNDDLLLDGVEVADGLRVMDTGIHESEKWGGGRLIRSGLRVARLKDKGVDFNTTKFSSRCVSKKSLVATDDVPENTTANRPQPEETQKLAPPCTSGPAATPPLPQKQTHVPPAATESPENCNALQRGRHTGAKGQWKGYVLADNYPPTSKGKLLLLDAPPALLPQRSTRSGKVFKPPEVEVALNRVEVMTVRKRGGSLEVAGHEGLQGNILF